MKKFATLLLAGLASVLSGGTAHVFAAELPTGLRKAIPELEASKQLIVVTSPGWNSITGTIRWFDREAGGTWKLASGPHPAVLGRSGMRWGIGLHGEIVETPLAKREGDGRSPAGVYVLGEVFGYASSEAASRLRMPYIAATPDLEGIDDPKSAHYNRIVRRSEVRTVDWTSSEKMRRKDELYRWGVVVRHNWDQRAGFGSCIFLHLWRSSKSGTAGCTAFAPNTMQALLSWLNQDSKPLLVQLPVAEYQTLLGDWGLPALR